MSKFATKTIPKTIEKNNVLCFNNNMQLFFKIARQK